MSLYELNNVEQYYDGRKVLSIDSLTLEENQIVGFFGPNGSGKSTLFFLYYLLLQNLVMVILSLMALIVKKLI